MYDNPISLGQVLGTSTAAILAGTQVLPRTGADPLILLLAWFTIGCGIIILSSFLFSRIAKRFF